MLKLYRLGLAATIVLGLILGLSPTQTQAQWPPFDFQVTHTYENGKITYHLDFHTKVRWLMTNLAFKMPVPEGTRFVEATAPAATTSSFDGTEVTFLTASLLGLGRSVNSPEIDISDVSFTVEVVDPTKTVFTTRAWLAWEGDQPGNYLIEDIAVDTTQAPLNWAPPRPPRLQLETMARAADGVITYIVYPQNVGTRVRMQDVKINIPIPAGTTYLSAEASHPFVANFNGQEVNFSALELERRAKIGPLKVQVAAEGATTPTVAMYAWATWKNAGGQVGQSIVAQEETRTADTIIQPQASEWVVSDLAGDVPLSNYDLTSIALKEEGTKLRVTFYMAGPLTSTGESLTYFLYIDSDCLRSTGKRIGGLGAEYRVRYKQHVNRANISAWDQSEKGWGRNHSIQANSVAGQNSFALWAPYNILQNDRQFCWVVEAENGTSALNPAPPLEKVPNGTNAALTQYEGVATASTTTTAPIEAAPVKKKPVSGVFIKPSDEWRYLPGWEEFPTDWQTLDFDDSDWLSGSASIGYGSGKYATNLSLIPAPVQTNEPLTITRQAVDQSGVVVAVLPSAHIGSFLMRRTFVVTNALSLTKLNLEVQYQGGFVAYLNGAEIARRGLGETDTPVLYNTLAETENGRKTREVIDVSSYIPNLVNGDNLLAIQVQRSLDDPRFSMAPKLRWLSNPAKVQPTNEPAVTTATPTETVAPAAPVALPQLTDISGKLAVPIDNGQGFYDVYIFSLPAGQEIAKIPYARQPNFHFDGQRLLINREGGGQDSLYEYNLADWTERQVSDAPKDSHPFYDPGGNRVVYGNPELTYGKPERVYDEDDKKYIFTGVHKPFIFVQCGLLPPHQEQEPRCQDIPNLGVLVPAGQMGEIQGTHPVWTSNDMIAFKGCNSWSGFSACGIYAVPSASTKGFSDGFIPKQLTKDTSDIPSDTKGNLITFTSQRDGNWEAYVMDLNGSAVKNLSNSSNSNDGLPVISPDGNWVAFISDREGRWAIWATPVVGGSVEKLFDLPAGVLWAEGERAWINERISWGP